MTDGIEFDPAKCRENRRKHGVPLGLAEELFEAEAVVEAPDRRRAYGEGRFVSVAPIGARLFVCVWTWRGALRRIIPLRKANAREARSYERKAGEKA